MRRHSGIVTAVDPQARTLAVEELAEVGKVRQHRVQVPPEARVLLPTRLPDDKVTDLRHPFQDTPIQLSEVRPGDFVVVELGEKGSEARAVTVTHRQ